MQEFIEPQIKRKMLKDPNFTKSDSVDLEKPYIKPGTVRVANILQVMRSKKPKNSDPLKEESPQTEN
jgi:hypothetical protein